MRTANGSTKERQPLRVITPTVIDTGSTTTTGEKCGDDMSMPMPSAMDYDAKPYGGAMTFAEVEAYEQAADQQEDLGELTEKFNAVMQNIMDAEDLSPTERAAAIASAAADFAAAAQDPEALDDDAQGKKSWWSKVKSLIVPDSGSDMTPPGGTIVGEKDWAKWNATHDHGGTAHGGGGPKGATAHSQAHTGKPASNGLKDLVDKLHAGSDQEKKDFVNYVTAGKGVEGKNLSDMVDKLNSMSDDEKKAFRHFVTGGHDTDSKAWNANMVGDGANGDNSHQHEDGTIHDHAGGDSKHAHEKFGGLAKKSVEDEQGAFVSFKDANNDWRFIATWSNNFEDRDGEVFPESAHKEFEQYVDETHDYPELQLWHIPGSKCGMVDMIAYDDGMCLATGKWDADKGDIAESFARAKELGVSHGYSYSPFEVRNGAYLKYRTFEISPLPDKRASNIGTDFSSFAATKEAPMLTAEKRTWLVDTIGEERAAQIEQNHRRMKKDLADKGISYKEFVDALVEGEAAAPPATATAGADGAKAAAATATTPPPAVIRAPGFKSEDGGTTWVKDEAPAADAAKTDPPATAAAVVVDDTKDVSFKEAITGAVMAAVKEANAPIIEALGKHETMLIALKEGDDVKIANAWASKQWGRDVKAATESDDNLIEGDKAKAVTTINGALDGDDPAVPYVKDLLQSLGIAN